MLYHFAWAFSSKSTLSTVTMQNLFCFTLIFLSVALSARGGIPDSLKSHFFLAGIPVAANSEYLMSQNSEQDPIADLTSENEKERMSGLQSAIQEARRNFSAGEISNHITAKPVDKAECYVKETVIHHHPGRCIRLRGGIPACQASDYTGVNYSECS